MAWFLPKDYVPVSKRVEQFHEKHPKWSIQTQYELNWDTVIFQATITFDDRVFNWTAFWSIKKDKALEKLESVSVWRALAFAWFEVQGWIASKEEMENFEDNSEEEKEIFDIDRYMKFKKRADEQDKKAVLAQVLTIFEKFEVLADAKTNLDLYVKWLK